MVFGEDKRFAAGRQGIAVALFDGLGSFAARQAQMIRRDCQIGACCEPHEIQSVGGWPSFVEVVHAPNQAAFFVPPSPEVLDMQIADGEHGGPLCPIRPKFRPKPESTAKGSAE